MRSTVPRSGDGDVRERMGGMSPSPLDASRPIPPVPAPARLRIATMFALRDAKRRWPFALRAGVCTAVPVLVGSLAGDVEAGLVATLGALTSLYGSGRPYLVRSVQLAVVAASFAAVVVAGIAATGVAAWLGVAMVVLVSMVATLLCNAFETGPPGAFMFTLACSAGIGLHDGHLSPARAGLLVLAGGALAWLIHMCGALVRPRGPEMSAVAAAGQAVARFVQSVGTPEEDSARHRTAVAMHASWAALVSDQPVDARPGSTLARLRGTNRELHRIYSEAMAAASRHEPVPVALAERAGQLGAAAAADRGAGDAPSDPLPLGSPGRRAILSAAIRPGSPYLIVVFRVGAAAAVAGAVAGSLGVERAYWAIVAAVMMLHQGLDWLRTVQRSIERLVGTWVGLVLAAALFAVHPSGLALVLVLFSLQFAVEMSIVRNYALAVVFITPMALTISTGGGRVEAIGSLTLARGVDTLIGCLVALAVYVLTPHRLLVPGLSPAVTGVLGALDGLLGHIGRADVTSHEARTARRDLQHRTLALSQAYDSNVNASTRPSGEAERMWPTVVAAQRLAYRALAECWAIERGRAARDRPNAQQTSLLRAAIGALADSMATGDRPPELENLPSFLSPELQTLRGTLTR